MYITAAYKFKNTPQGFRAIRQGELQVYGKKPGERLSARMIYIKNVLLRKFGKIFEPEMKLQGFKFNEGKLAAAGQFVPQEIISHEGWLAVGYGRQKTSSGTTASNN